MQLPHPIKQHTFSYFIVPSVYKTQLWNYWPALLNWLSVALNMNATRLTCNTLESCLSCNVEVNVVLRTSNMSRLTRADMMGDWPRVVFQVFFDPTKAVWIFQSHFSTLGQTTFVAKWTFKERRKELRRKVFYCCRLIGKHDTIWWIFICDMRLGPLKIPETKF